MSKQKKLLTLATLGTLLILTLVMIQLTGLIPAVGTWYSYDPALRLQSEAFLRGELAIQPVPYGHLHDWAWGNGMHQVWGLGVPLLQLPFQVAGKLVNGFGFPDRLIFLFFYAGVAALFWRALDAGSESSDDTERLKWRLLTLPLLLYAFLNHALINMMVGKYEPYEEVISYGFLWSLLLFALLTIFLYQRGPYLYLLLCLLAGFAMNLRPTCGAYGGVTFVLAFFLAWRNQVKFRWIGLALFLLGVGFYFLMNDLRFGSPFEAGHNLGLSNHPFSNYIVKFDNPMTWIPFSSAALELLSGLFFLDLTGYYESNWLLWAVNVPRVREINFKPFYAVEFILLLLAWSLLLLLWRRHRRNPPLASAPGEELMATGIAWSLASFVLLFFFYARWPGLVSRYLVDFAPALIIGIATLYRYLITRHSHALPLKLLGAGTLVALTIIPLGISQVISLYGDPVTVTTLSAAREKLLASRRTTGPPLPGEYRCGNQQAQQYEIPYNNTGWNIAGDCAVGMASIHFLERPECLEISLAPFANAPEWARKEYSDQEIAIKLGTTPLQRVSEVVTGGGGKAITFCRTAASRPQWSGSPIEMISIKWFNLREHPNYETIPLALLALKKLK